MYPQGTMFPGRLPPGQPGAVPPRTAPPPQPNFTTGMNSPQVTMPGQGLTNFFGQMGAPPPMMQGGMGQLPQGGQPRNMGPTNMGPGNMGPPPAMSMPGRGVVQPNQMVQAGGMQQARMGMMQPPGMPRDTTFGNPFAGQQARAAQYGQEDVARRQAEGPVSAPSGSSMMQPYGAKPMDTKGRVNAGQQAGMPVRKPAARPPRKPAPRKPMAGGSPDMAALADQMYPRKPMAR